MSKKLKMKRCKDCKWFGRMWTKVDGIDKSINCCSIPPSYGLMILNPQEDFYCKYWQEEELNY